MKRKIIATLALSLLCMTQASAQTESEIVEIDGIYYALEGSLAKLALPADNPDFQYSGVLSIPSKVVYGSTEYTVDCSNNNIALMNSSVTELIVEEGHKKFSAHLTNDDCLEKISVKTTSLDYDYDVTGYPGAGYPGTINVGNHPGCAYVTHYAENGKAVFHIETFNVYGPDGQQLKPFLAKDGNFSDPDCRIYPDENGNFTLDEDLIDNLYYGIMRVADIYYMVLLYCEVTDGQPIIIRCQPKLDQTGIYTTVDNIKYMIAPQYAVIESPADGQILSGDITIPEKVVYDGKEIPVTKIANNAFAESDITSVTLPSTIEEIGTFTFSNCSKLKSADLSACSSLTYVNGNSAFGLFYQCQNLTDVSLPENLGWISLYMFRGCSSLSGLTLGENVKTIYGGAFSGCESLTTLAINEGTKIFYAFSECPSLVKATVLESTDEAVKFKVETTLTQTDGTPLIPQARTTLLKDGNIEITMLPIQDGIVTFSRSDNPDADGIDIYVNNSDNTYLPEPGDEGTYALCYVEVPEPGQVGVTDETIGCPDDTPATFYNLQGSKVSGSNMRPGIYIKVQGDKASKVLIR